MNILKRIKIIGTSLLLLTLPGMTAAQQQGGVGGGFGEGFVTGLKGPDDTLPVAIIKIVNGFLVLAAIIAAVFIIVGGVQYIFSAGNESRADSAKNTILYAILGLIIIGLAAAITAFVSTVLLS